MAVISLYSAYTDQPINSLLCHSFRFLRVQSRIVPRYEFRGCTRKLVTSRVLDFPAIHMATSLSKVPTPPGDLLNENISPSVDEKYVSRGKDASHNIHITSDKDPHVIDSGTSRSGTKTLRNFRSWFSSDSWQLEILSFFITLVCFACLIIVLQKFDNKPLPNWRSGLTLNTVVSWISTVLKATLLLPVGSCISQLSWVWFNEQTRSLADICFFDAASRGPWGSLKLIFRLRGM